jgi:hypothetical protein
MREAQPNNNQDKTHKYTRATRFTRIQEKNELIRVAHPQPE